MHEPLTHQAEIQRILELAVGAFNAGEARYLLEPGNQLGGANEPTIGANFTVHLTAALRGANVPTSVAVAAEYNRFGGDEKFLDHMEAYADDIKKAGRELDPEGRLSIFPDIIVHEFGRTGTNYLVIEIKKDSNAAKAQVKFDRIKLACMTMRSRAYRYILGAELRAHDVADVANRTMEVCSYWANGEEIWRHA